MGQTESSGLKIKKGEDGDDSSNGTTGGAGLSNVLLMMDQYLIKLTAEQRAELYGFLSTKQRILKWSNGDIMES